MDIYLLFGGLANDPEGGLWDYDTHYPTLEAAQVAVLSHFNNQASHYWQWANIAHVTQNGVVKCWEWRGEWELMK